MDLNRRLAAMKIMDFVFFSFLCMLLDFAVGACTRCGCSNSFSHAGLPGKPGRDGRDGPPGTVGPPAAGQFGTPSTTVSDYIVIECLLLIVCYIFRKDSSAVVTMNLRAIQKMQH